MTEMQKLRNVMFDEIDRIKRGTSTNEESLSVVKLGNAIINTYNTELKTIETIIKVQESGADVPEISIFKDDKKCIPLN
jgi:hypothetical protein